MLGGDARGLPTTLREVVLSRIAVLSAAGSRWCGRSPRASGPPRHQLLAEVRRAARRGAAGRDQGSGGARRGRRRRERRGLPAAAWPDDRGRDGRPAPRRAHRPAPAVRAGPGGERGVHAARPGRPARPPLVRGGRRGAGAGRVGGGGLGVRGGPRAHRGAPALAARGGASCRACQATPSWRGARSASTARPGPPSSAATTTRRSGCSTSS